MVAITILFLLPLKASPQIHINEAEAKEEVIIEEVKELTVEEKIELKAIEYGLDPVIMKRIAWSESQYQNVWNYMYSVNPNYYTAFGIFQIVRSTYQSFCGDPDDRFDIDKNIECAMIIASESGLHHWDESKYAWNS